MNHAIQKDIEKRDQMAEYIQKAIDALQDALKFNAELDEQNLWGTNNLGFIESHDILTQITQLRETKENYIKRRKYEDNE